MAKSHSVNLYEHFIIYDECARQDARTNGVLKHTKRYYKAKEIRSICKNIATPVNLLYVSAFDIKPLETVMAVDKKTTKGVIFLKDKIVFRETYWDNVLFNIHILESAKIRDIRKTQYVPAVKNERLAFSDNISKNAGKSHKQVLSLKDGIVKENYINKSELISIIDSHKKHLANIFKELFITADRKDKVMGIAQHDEIRINDKTAKDMTAICHDIFQAADIISKKPVKYIDDIMTAMDYYKKDSSIYRHEHITVFPDTLKGLTRRFSEDLSVLSKNINSPYKLSKEQTVTLTDNERKNLGVIRKELIHFTEIYWDNVLFLVHVTENIRTSDAVHKFIGTQIYEALALISKLRNETEKTQKERITIDDRKISELLTTIQEQINIADSLRKSLRRTIKEQNISIKSMLRKNPLKISKDSVVIKEQYKKTWQAIKNLRDFLCIVDKSYRNIHKENDERISAADKLLKHIEHKMNDKVSTNESFNRSVDYNRYFSDFIKAGDKLTRKIGKNPMEDVLIWDAYIRASNCYIETLRIIDKAEDEKWFDSMVESMPNYEEFSDFLVGDYEYEKACIRLVLSSSLTDSAPTIYDVAANVDIDDTDDRGTVRITDTAMPTKVYYNKHYYNAPEVQVSVNSGMGNETVTPYILRTDGMDNDKRYFEVELRNDSNERVVGYISWVSKGW